MAGESLVQVFRVALGDALQTKNDWDATTIALDAVLAAAPYVADGPTALRNAWTLIAACPHKDTDDGTCRHPHNVTPECHEGACPYAR